MKLNNLFYLDMCVCAFNSVTNQWVLDLNKPKDFLERIKQADFQEFLMEYESDNFPSVPVIEESYLEIVELVINAFENFDEENCEHLVIHEAKKELESGFADGSTINFFLNVFMENRMEFIKVLRTKKIDNILNAA